MAKANKTKAKNDIFKTRKSRESAPTTGDTITPPEKIADAIDAFREAQEQAKHFEGEATVQKDIINDYSLGEFATRALKGKPKSFKLLGHESMVTYVVMDASAGITDEEVEAFRERWGDEAADELIIRDLASIRFDGQVLEANYDAVVDALSALPKDILNSLFKPMLMRAAPGVVEKAKRFAKTPAELKELMQQLKIRNYVR